MTSTAYKLAPIVLATSFVMTAPLASSDSSEVTGDVPMETVIVTATRQACRVAVTITVSIGTSPVTSDESEEARGAVITNEVAKTIGANL